MEDDGGRTARAISADSDTTCVSGYISRWIDGKLRSCHMALYADGTVYLAVDDERPVRHDMPRPAELGLA